MTEHHISARYNHSVIHFLKHKRKALVRIFLLFTLCLVGFIFYQGWRLASPSKRSIQTYHNSWLETPENHGMKIQSTSCLDGKIPTLILEPSTPLGKRGSLIRKQLIDRGQKIISEVDHTVVLLHGRNGRKEDLLAVGERFCAVGLRCILIDLPAHGDSPLETVQFGASDWEQNLPYRVLLECAERYHFSPAKASLWGMSMGGSFANHACADSEHGSHWKSLIIVCSFDRLDKVINNQVHSQWITSLVSKSAEFHGGVKLSKAAPEQWVKSVHTPVMVVHGDQDTLIPLENGKNLYNSYASKDKRWITVAGGNHSNILITPMPLFAEMACWILSHQ